MTWGRIDDHLDDDERWWGLPMESVGLFWSVLPYCLRHDTNFIPAVLLLRVCHVAQENPNCQPLLRSGLWDEADGGYTYNPADWTRMRMPEEKRQELNRKRSQAGKLGAASRWQRDGKALATPRQDHGKNAPEPEPEPKVAKATTPLNAPQGAVVSDAVLTFVETWNSHCRPLPKLRKPPQRPNDVRLMTTAVEYFDGDADQLGAAIERAARDDQYRQKRYGFETFCRHLASRWGEDVPTESAADNPIDRRIREASAAGRGWRPSTVIEMRAAANG